MHLDAGVLRFVLPRTPRQITLRRRGEGILVGHRHRVQVRARRIDRPVSAAYSGLTMRSNHSISRLAVPRAVRSLVRRWPASLLLAVASAAGCSSADRGPEFEVSEQPWSYRQASGIHLTTDHFELFTTIHDAELRDYLPGFLEACFQQYSALLPLPAGSERRLKTYLFATQRQWMNFTRERFPSRSDLLTSVQVGGYASGDLCVTRYIQPRTYTLSVIAHEGLHQYFGTHFEQRLPAWLNEGLATYCEGFDVRAGRPVFSPKNNTFRRNPLRQTLAANALLPLSELLATSPGKVIVQSQSRLTRAYYAQAWALVVFLQHGGNERFTSGFRQMLDDVATGQLGQRARAARISSGSPTRLSFGEAVFRAYITEDLAAFEQQYRNYMTELVGF